MSITLMSEVWPLDLPSTDKLVLLALADAANDEDSRTWIPVKSKITHNRAGRVKLSLVIKCSLSDRAIQHSIKRLIEAGHISRKEKPGIGVDFWVHPVKAGDSPPNLATPEGDSGAKEIRTEPDVRGPEASSGEARTRFAQTLNNPKQSSAGAQTRAPHTELTQHRPSGSAVANSRSKVPLQAQNSESVREQALRAAILEWSGGKAAGWLEKSVLKVSDMAEVGGPISLTIVYSSPDYDRIKRREPGLQIIASETLGVEVKWVSVVTAARKR